MLDHKGEGEPAELSTTGPKGTESLTIHMVRGRGPRHQREELKAAIAIRSSCSGGGLLASHKKSGSSYPSKWVLIHEYIIGKVQPEQESK